MPTGTGIIPNTSIDDFDRSFNYFTKGYGGGKLDSFVDDFSGGECESGIPENGVLKFSVSDSDNHSKTNQSFQFPTTTDYEQPETSAPDVLVKVREQVSAMYDDASQEGSISVSGSICVKSPKATRFTLVLKDNQSHIHRVESIRTSSTIGKDMDEEKVIRVDLTGTESNEDMMVANYFCLPELRPVPLLVKSRVSLTNDHARVGFKVRANPSNQHVINAMVVMVAVPPDIDGGNCKMSRKGGSWEDLKRTMTWCIPVLNPGEAIEIQAQFPILDGSTKVPQFPVLVRCDYPVLFSGVTVALNDNSNAAMKFSFHETVLHRKV